MKTTQDPEIYARMSEPHATREMANESLRAFIDDVKTAREKHRCSDVVIIVAATCPEDEDGAFACFAAAYGDSTMSAQLGALAYQRFTQPTIDAAQALERLAKAGKNGDGP